MDVSKQKYELISTDRLDESFIATAMAVGAAYPTTEARPYFEVVAPAMLPEVCVSIIMYFLLEFFCCIMYHVHLTLFFIISAIKRVSHSKPKQMARPSP
jgi:hypothetical protein